MSSPHRTPPRWVRWTLGVVALVVPCVVWGLTTATAERSLGPHEATYEVTTDGLVVVDLGPLGTLQIDSPLPLGLGVDVTVQEIPSDLTAVGQAETLEGLSQDLEDYLRFFGGPQETISSVARALVVDALRRTGLALLVVAAGGASVYLLLGAALFTIGGVGLLVRRNPLVMFMCIELMLNAVNLSFVAFSRALNDRSGQTAVFFVLVVAAAEVVVGLGIIVAILRRKPGATADDIAMLKG